MDDLTEQERANLRGATERELEELREARRQVDLKYFRLIYKYSAAIEAKKKYLAAIDNKKESQQLYCDAHWAALDARNLQRWLDTACEADKLAFADLSKKWDELTSDHQQIHGPATYISHRLRDNGEQYMIITKVYNRGTHFDRVVEEK